MEAAGSRQSRAASRYAASPSPPVFSGPVRKWKKQWVSCSHSTNTNANNGGKRNEAPPLLLRRWTPLSADEPPARRFRYTPIVPIRKGKSRSVDDEGMAPDLSKEEEPQVCMCVMYVCMYVCLQI
ncbi:hypothetical protein C2S51_013384 [Perilla frutescens var. frutescens]|nr:hypothetical protein C2S51_013384 [Perilla frutescens var. frutescens]